MKTTRIYITSLVLIVAPSDSLYPQIENYEYDIGRLPSEITYEEIYDDAFTYSNDDLWERNSRSAPPGGGPAIGEVIVTPILNLRYIEIIALGMLYVCFILIRNKTKKKTPPQ